MSKSDRYPTNTEYYNLHEAKINTARYNLHEANINVCVNTIMYVDEMCFDVSAFVSGLLRVTWQVHVCQFCLKCVYKF